MESVLSICGGKKMHKAVTIPSQRVLLVPAAQNAED